MIKKLTPTQQSNLDAIKQFIECHGYAPTVREIGWITGVSSPSTTHAHLRTLKEKGYIDYVDGKARTIRIIKEKKEWKKARCMNCGTELNYNPISSPKHCSSCGGVLVEIKED